MHARSLFCFEPRCKFRNAPGDPRSGGSDQNWVLFSLGRSEFNFKKKEKKAFRKKNAQQQDGLAFRFACKLHC